MSNKKFHFEFKKRIPKLQDFFFPFTFKKEIIVITYYRVTNYSPNPKELGYKPNEPNTMNL